MLSLFTVGRVYWDPREVQVLHLGKVMASVPAFSSLQQIGDLVWALLGLYLEVN